MLILESITEARNVQQSTMKRIIFLLLLTFVVVLIASCQGNQAQPTDTMVAAVEPTATSVPVVEPTGEASKIIERGRLVMDPDRHSSTWDGKSVTLTVTEFLILQALAQRPGIVKSRDSLMDAAYDDQVYVDDRTIDSHIKRLRKKFKAVDDDFDAIETLYGVGYRFREM